MPSLTTLTPAAECWSGEILSANYVAPSLQPHYRTFNTTTNNSAPICWHRYFTFRLRLIVFPFTSNSRFPRSDTTPVLRSCLLYPGCRLINNQDFSKLLPRHQTSLGFDNVFILSRPHQRFVCTHLRRTYLTDLIPPFPQRSLPRP